MLKTIIFLRHASVYVCLRKWMCAYTSLCEYLFYFERCKIFGLSHVPVAVVLFGGFIQNGGKDNTTCVCVCACFFRGIKRHIHMFIYNPIEMQGDF